MIESAWAVAGLDTDDSFYELIRPPTGPKLDYIVNSLTEKMENRTVTVPDDLALGVSIIDDVEELVQTKGRRLKLRRHLMRELALRPEGLILVTGFDGAVITVGSAQGGEGDHHTQIFVGFGTAALREKTSGVWSVGQITANDKPKAMAFHLPQYFQQRVFRDDFEGFVLPNILPPQGSAERSALSAQDTAASAELKLPLQYTLLFGDMASLECATGSLNCTKKYFWNATPGAEELSKWFSKTAGFLWLAFPNRCLANQRKILALPVGQQARFGVSSVFRMKPEDVSGKSGSFCALLNFGVRSATSVLSRARLPPKAAYYVANTKSQLYVVCLFVCLFSGTMGDRLPLRDQTHVWCWNLHLASCIKSNAHLLVMETALPESKVLKVIESRLRAHGLPECGLNDDVVAMLNCLLGLQNFQFRLLRLRTASAVTEWYPFAAWMTQQMLGALQCFGEAGSYKARLTPAQANCAPLAANVLADLIDVNIPPSIVDDRIQEDKHAALGKIAKVTGGGGAGWSAMSDAQREELKCGRRKNDVDFIDHVESKAKSRDEEHLEKLTTKLAAKEMAEFMEDFGDANQHHGVCPPISFAGKDDFVDEDARGKIAVDSLRCLHREQIRIASVAEANKRLPGVVRDVDVDRVVFQQRGLDDYSIGLSDGVQIELSLQPTRFAIHLAFKRATYAGASLKFDLNWSGGQRTELVMPFTTLTNVTTQHPGTARAVDPEGAQYIETEVPDAYEPGDGLRIMRHTARDDAGAERVFNMATVAGLTEPGGPVIRAGATILIKLKVASREFPKFVGVLAEPACDRGDDADEQPLVNAETDDLDGENDADIDIGEGVDTPLTLNVGGGESELFGGGAGAGAGSASTPAAKETHTLFNVRNSPKVSCVATVDRGDGGFLLTGPYRSTKMENQSPLGKDHIYLRPRIVIYGGQRIGKVMAAATESSSSLCSRTSLVAEPNTEGEVPLALDAEQYRANIREDTHNRGKPLLLNQSHAAESLKVSCVMALRWIHEEQSVCTFCTNCRCAVFLNADTTSATWGRWVVLKQVSSDKPLPSDFNDGDTLADAILRAPVHVRCTSVPGLTA
jgi:hypothetical protein